MKRTNKTNRRIILILTILVGIISAILIHGNSWFKFSPTLAEIPMNTEIQINNTTNGTDVTSIALDDLGRSVITWAHYNGSDTDTYFRIYDKNNVALTSETIATVTTSNDQFQPSVAMDEHGNFAITWTGYNAINGTYDIYTRAFQPDGTPIGGEVLVNTTVTNDDTNPKIAIDYNGPSNTSRFVISWTHYNGTDNDINFQLFNVDFSQTTTPPSKYESETLMNSGLSGDQYPSDVAMNTLGEFIVTARHDPGAADIIIYRIYSQNGTALTPVTLGTSASYLSIEPAAAADKKARSTLNDTEDIRFIISYRTKPLVPAEYNIGNLIISCTDPNTTNSTDTDLTCATTSPEIQDTRSTAIAKSAPAVDADYLGNFTVVWNDETIDGNQWGIVGQSYNYKGQKISDPFQVNGTITTDNQAFAAIAMNTDGFYDVSFFDYGGSDVFYKKYVTEIFKIENETLTHPAAPSSTQSTVVTAMSPTNNQVIVWMDYETTPISLKYTLQEVDRTDPANPSLVKLIDNVAIITGNNINNPSVTFFKDDINCNKFIITWENDLGSGNSKDIFYQVFDSSGTAENLTPQTLIATTATEVKPVVAASVYNNGSTDVKTFSIGWIDETNNSIKSIYHNNGTFTQTTISTTCNSETCRDVKNTINPNNNRVVYLFETGTTEIVRSLFLQQLDGYTLVGNPIEVHSTDTWNTYSDIDFITDDDFVTVYSMNGNDDILGSRYTYDAILGGDSNQDPDLVEDFNITQTYVSGISTLEQDLYPKISAFPTNDPNLQQFLITWNLRYPTTPAGWIGVMGQFIDYSGSTVKPFGPSFAINSTQTGLGGFLPDVGYNKYGLGIIAWEAETPSDSTAVAYQIIQNPSITDQVSPLEPICRQEIIAGGLTMTAPTSISFPSASASATETITQSVSIRDSIYGGDIKYIEVQDATGQDFTLSLQVSDFVALADNKSYIKADQHFKIRNWDGSTTDTNINCDALNPLNCFSTEASTYTPTAFSLNSETQNFVSAKTQKVIGSKSTTQQNEIGKWKFYPEFEITIPPIIPPGLHEAEITFTLVN